MNRTVAWLIKVCTIKNVGIVIIGCTITGCTQQASPKNRPYMDRPQIEVVVSEPDRIRFKGKGAGAGMMMAGTMGPMGIAIGVAIDEGIGKDIDGTAREGNVEIKTLLREAAEAALDKPGHPLARIEADTIQIVVERYGFVTASGEGDPVQPQLHVTFLYDGDEKQTLRIPEGFKSAPQFVFDTYQLDKIKTNAETIRRAFNNIVEFAVDRELVSRALME